MEYVVHELSRHGITDIIFAVGYKGSMVEEYFGDGSGFIAPDGTPITVHYAYEEELLGTAGAIKNAGRFVTEDSFFVLNADTFYHRLQPPGDHAAGIGSGYGTGAPGSAGYFPVRSSRVNERTPYRL